MNIYILTDMEGISLVTEWEQVEQGHAFYPKYQQILTAEVNAAVEGAFAAGATRVVVNDGHGSKDYNLVIERLNSNIEIERPDSSVNIFPSMDESFDTMLLVGYHAMEGTPGAVLAHTQSHPNISFFEVNGTRYGEIGQMSIIAGHFQVPVAYISGDQAAVNEARGLLGDDLPATVVKVGHAKGKATSLHPEEAARRIRNDVEQALKRPKREPYRIPGPSPYEVTYGYKSKGLADSAALKPNVRRINDFTVSKTIHSARDILS